MQEDSTPHSCQQNAASSVRRLIPVHMSKVIRRVVFWCLESQLGVPPCALSQVRSLAECGESSSDDLPRTFPEVQVRLRASRERLSFTLIAFSLPFQVLSRELCQQILEDLVLEFPA